MFPEEKREFLRSKTLDEMLSSEEKYLHHLNLLVKYFMEPILEHKMLPDALYRSVFGNIGAIQAVNKRLMEELRRHSVTDTIGQALLSLAPYLKLYAAYANGIEQVQESLQKYERKNSSFYEFKRRQECHPELAGLKLDSLLITPIQRIPRYKLLLNEIINYTSPEHHDYNKLIDAEKVISDIAIDINNNINRVSDIKKLMIIQQALKDGKPQLISPGRYLLKEGIIKKLSRKGNGEHKRTLFLFTDIIMYCKQLCDDYTNRPSSLVCRCILPLSQSDACCIFGALFKISCKNESILFYCDTPEECNSWVETVTVAIRNNNDRKRTLRKDASCKGPLKRRVMLKQRINNVSSLLDNKARKRANNDDRIGQGDGDRRSVAKQRKVDYENIQGRSNDQQELDSIQICDDNSVTEPTTDKKSNSSDDNTSRNIPATGERQTSDCESANKRRNSKFPCGIL
ncbi:RhoGEF4 (predicted) [Pycnogonum litorale]